MYRINLNARMSRADEQFTGLIMLRRTISTIFIYLFLGISAFVVTGAIHVFSGRGIWSIWPWAHEVRAFGVYLADVVPFFLVVFGLLNFAYLRWRSQEAPSLIILVGIGISTVAVSALVHIWFFPTSARALAMFTIMAVIFIGGLTTLNAIMGSVRFLQPWHPFPRTRSWGGAVMAALVIVVFVGGFRGALSIGLIPAQNETYQITREPSPASTIVDRSDTRTALPQLFERHNTPFKLQTMRLYDADQDGLVDVIGINYAGSLEFWRNTGGQFEQDETFFDGIFDTRISDFYMIDADNDGDLDIMLGRVPLDADKVYPWPTKASNWFLVDKPSSKGHLFQNNGPGAWTDLTATAFPDGQPWGFIKVEPMLWFDANDDGRLDLVWHQYPHPHQSVNKLYVQDEDGVFKDRMADIIDWTESDIYPEGTDAADYDHDGDIDFFSYGYLFRNDGEKYTQICGDAMPGVHCKASGRNDEGSLFEDFDNDGHLDLMLSYHGVGGDIPKYYLQLLRGTPDDPNYFVRDSDLGQTFYGFNSYMRAVDADLDGNLDVLTNKPGRLIQLNPETNNTWVDFLPAITGRSSGEVAGFGWIDADDDGDWDFFARDMITGDWLFYNNKLNPNQFVRLGVTDHDGALNQIGATMRIKGSDGSNMVRVSRPLAGYAGTMDPRVILNLKRDMPYEIEVCFARIGAPFTTPDVPTGITASVRKHDGNCAVYDLKIDSGVNKIDITFLAGGIGLRAQPI